MSKSVEMIGPDGRKWDVPLENVGKFFERDGDIPSKFSNPEDEQLYQSYVQSGAKKRSEPNTSPTTWLDRGKEFAQGAAHNVGETLDTVNKYVSAVPPMIAGKMAKSVGRTLTPVLPNAGKAISEFGQGAQNIADQFHNSNLADEYANADFLKTDNNPDETSEIFKAGGEFLGEGVKFATGAKVLDSANKTINAVQIVTRQGKTVAMPWLNKLNSLLSSQGENIARTSAQFAAGGMGAEVGKQLQGRDDRKPAENTWEEIKNATADTTVDMAGFLFGGLTLDAANKPLMKATREASKIVTSYVDYLRNPTKEAWLKVKEEFPEIIKSPIKSSFNKMYEKLANNAENKIDEKSLIAMNRAGIKPSALSIYEDNDRVFTIANILPSKIYRTYAANLEKDVLKTIETDLNVQLGIIDPMTWKAEESMIREASKKLDSVIEKPDLPKIYNETALELSERLNSVGELPRTPSWSLDAKLPIDEGGFGGEFTFSPIKAARDNANNEINRVKNNFISVKNTQYENAKKMLSRDDYVNLDRVHKAASELFTKYDIPGTKKTSMGNVRSVAEDVKKGTAIHKNLPDMVSKDFSKEFQEILTYDKIHPQYLLDMARGLNQQISEGFVKGDDKIALTNLTRAIDDTLKEAIQKGTIKDKHFLKYKQQADEFFKDIYLPFVTLDATKAISSGKTPHYIWQQMNTIDGRHEIKEALNKLPQGNDLFKVLQRTKAQEYIMSNISDGTDINPKKLTNLVKDMKQINELVDLIGEETYGMLKYSVTRLADNITKAQTLSKNPIIADNSVNNIIKLINSREGIELIKEQVAKLPKEESVKVMNSINRVAAKFNIENEITSQDKLNNDKLMSMLTDLKEEDYLVGVLGKDGLEKFKKDILPLSKKLIRINNKDIDAGGYIASKDVRGIGHILKGYVGDAGTGISGYGLGGVKGAIAAVLGKNWFAYSFAKAATDPKLVNRLIELGRKGNEKQLESFITRVSKNAAKNTLLQLDKPAFKLYNAKEATEKGKEMLPDLSTEEGKKRFGNTMGNFGRNGLKNIAL